MKSSIAIFHNDTDYAQALKQGLQSKLDNCKINLWHEGMDAPYLLAWKPNQACLQMPSLEVIFGLGAGVDAFIYNPHLSEHIKIVRLEEAGMGDQMLEFALYGILHYSRGFDNFYRAKQTKNWLGASTPKKLPFTTKIGVMGLGKLGAHVAIKLAAMGYPVSGFSQEIKHIQNITCYGKADLKKFLSQCEVLICLMPLTDNTRNFLDYSVFSVMPQDAFVINLARGGLLVEDDLLRSMNEKQISGALLDVFQVEPLPKEHPFWDDDRILITPHLAAITTQTEAISQISQNILRHLQGKSLHGLVDRSRQY